MDEKDQGFTLIELLVVIIIIGILAAIAIPVFLNQRKKGWDAQAKSDLKNMATAQETVLTDSGNYTNDVTKLNSAGFKESTDTTDHTAWTSTSAGTAGGYCLSVKSKSGLFWSYTSASTVPASAETKLASCAPLPFPGSSRKRSPDPQGPRVPTE
jgi:type IV pilus assembly protein PilA